MAGRIPDRDIAAIRERTRIEDVVGDYVQLRRAGADSLKGLCPFHDEKSPSFHVRPNHGHFHCFGCGEGGDVYAFVQKIEHVSFVEAVELLADRVGYTVTYTGAAATNVQRDRGSRSRLLRFDPGVFTTAPFVHDHWEEVYLMSGDLIVGNDADGNGGEAFQPNTYACRPPGAYHGPFKSAKGCMLFEIHYYDESKR